jgi:hypothetical protein
METRSVGPLNHIGELRVRPRSWCLLHRGTSLEVSAAGGAEVKIMRKRYRVLILAVLVAAIAVPLGFALSLESTPAVVVASPAEIGIVAASSARSHVALVQAPVPRRMVFPTLPDGAKLLFVGSALFGLAGVMRRAD